MRLFVALDIDNHVRDNIVRFMNSVRDLAPNARWVRPESLHVTLKFIGERSSEEVPRIKEALTKVRSGSFKLTFRGFGFFPAIRASKTFWIGVEGGAQLLTLAATIDEQLAPMGIAKEQHAFTPHLTLARAADSRSRRSPKSSTAKPGFERLREKLASLSPADFDKVTLREFFLYQSQLAPGGSKYIKLASFLLY